MHELPKSNPCCCPHQAMAPLGMAPTPGVTVQPQAAFPCAGECWALQTAKLRVPTVLSTLQTKGKETARCREKHNLVPSLPGKLLLLLLSELLAQLSA